MNRTTLFFLLIAAMIAVAVGVTLIAFAG